MYYHKFICLTLFSFLLLLLANCATTYAPDNWLPDTEGVQQDTYGGWITLSTMPDSLDTNKKWLQYSGEFISLDEKNVYLFYDSLYIIPKDKIYYSTLELDEKSNVEFGLWTFGGIVSTISNGVYLIITAPLWLLGGLPATVSESSRDRYEMQYPDYVYWENIRRFARFPQGITDIDLTSIKPKMKIIEE